MRKILFVCTANTCRSAMAQAIAKAMIEKSGADVEADGAGVFADGFSPATEAAEDAVKKFGASLKGHRSKRFTKELADASDKIYAMTSDHRALILEAFPELKDKVFVLDPSGEDIADPYGAPQEIYDICAERISRCVKKRIFG